MSRSGIIALVFSSMLLFLAAKPQNDKFSKYKSVEAYEIRPGILMMPRYAEDGQACEIGLERRHYTPEVIHLESSIWREDVDELVDEFAPVNERGAKSKSETTIEDGGCRTTFVDYENVSVRIYSSAKYRGKRAAFVDEGVAVTIKWKNRKCQ